MLVAVMLGDLDTTLADAVAAFDLATLARHSERLADCLAAGKSTSTFATASFYNDPSGDSVTSSSF